MSMPDYVQNLRSAVGHQRLILVGASAVIYDNAGHILLVRRQDTGWWALPAGIMEMDEAISDTVVREVEEETGLQVRPLRLTGLYTDPEHQNMTYPHGDQVHVVNASFECEIMGGIPHADGVETVDVAFFPPDALPELRAAHILQIQDALANRPEAYVR